MHGSKQKPWNYFILNKLLFNFGFYGVDDAKRNKCSNGRNILYFIFDSKDLLCLDTLETLLYQFHLRC